MLETKIKAVVFAGIVRYISVQIFDKIAWERMICKHLCQPVTAVA